MDQFISRKLTALNNQFYQSFSEHFSATRQRLQPGVLRIIESLPPANDVLDLGCGNGQLANEISSRNFQFNYLGVDFSGGLLSDAQNNQESSQFSFLELDFTAEDWTDHLPLKSFDVVLCFAALHHVPGYDLRSRICRDIHYLLRPGGVFIHSNWQFLKSDRLRKRILPWSTVEIKPEELEPGDYLIDWRRGGKGQRYVHYFSEEELIKLAEESSFQILETFYSDGKEGDLSVYQRWSPI